jgi:hypothetical protein
MQILQILVQPLLFRHLSLILKHCFYHLKMHLIQQTLQQINSELVNFRMPTKLIFHEILYCVKNSHLPINRSHLDLPKIVNIFNSLILKMLPHLLFNLSQNKNTFPNSLFCILLNCLLHNISSHINPIIIITIIIHPIITITPIINSTTIILNPYHHFIISIIMLLLPHKKSPKILANLLQNNLHEMIKNQGLKL